MAELIRADLCIIGAGSAGLSIAAGAAQMGARTVLIEAHRMGGDCLNSGCVPSKSLLAAAKVAHAVRNSAKTGIAFQEPHIEFAQTQRYVHDVIQAIAPHDSVDRFTGLGCQVIEAPARFVDGRTVAAGDFQVRARRYVIASGSHPYVPPIEGLANTPYFTNETIFENTVLPEHLIIIGAGPMGSEMAQAHRRLGARVTLLDAARMLPRDDPEAVECLRERLSSEGVDIIVSVEIIHVALSGSEIEVTIRDDGRERKLRGSHLLLAAGRRANVAGLGLDQAGVKYDEKRIVVDARLRTTNKRIFAAGDVIGGQLLTHAAGYHASIVLKNALFRLPAKKSESDLPWVTYTDPELAQVGLTESSAKKVHGDSVRVLRAEFAQNDRARADGTSVGFLKAVVSKRGKILGATIVGPHAGELLLPWALAIAQGNKIGVMAGLTVPYPTLSEITKRAAGSYFTPALFSPRIRRLVRFLGVFG